MKQALCDRSHAAQILDILNEAIANGTTRMLEQIILHAEAQGLHALVGGITTDNLASIATHLECGFEHCGTVRQVGYKFGAWMDLAFYQRLLAGPAAPADG